MDHPTKESAKLEIGRLVSLFRDNLASYKLSSYKEARLRVDFLNPFLKALGWDVDNTQGLTPSFREVVTEDHVLVEGRSKAPDYSIRKQDGTRFFFIEAKKPQINISTAKEPAFQLRRYGWSADLPISVLASFEFFAVYDCTIKPKSDDLSKKARLKIIYFEDYLAEFDYIWDHFSKAAVLAGSLNQFRSRVSRRGTASVDKDFLESLNSWRITLAKNIHEHNPLEEEQLNYIVQQTLDRIIFLRIAEDRHVEEYGSLLSVLKARNGYKALFDLFKDADSKYNSGLFKQDQISSSLKLPNNVLEEVIAQLYYPNSPYEFSVLPIEILGKAYEQFLGKKILITAAGRIKIEEKPEVRKAGGVYYTPRYIVEYIVRNTVGKICEGKTVDEVAKIKILDPASGSGSFLIFAYEYLLNWHKDYFTKNKKEIPKALLKEAVTPTGELTTKFKGKILVNNIFGVDIDANAVEVTKLSLLLKCLEGETKETVQAQRQLFQERLLPTLDENIRCGNSLIDFDIYYQFPDLEDDIRVKRKINAFNWRRGFAGVFAQGGFDAVIGNPPYDVLEKDRSRRTTPHNSLQKYIQTTQHYDSVLGGKLNIYRIFLMKCLKVAKNNGRFGMIVPLSILADISCKHTRKFMLEHTDGLIMDCFPQKDNPSKRVFLEAKLSTVIITANVMVVPRTANYSFKVRTYPENLFIDECKKVEISIDDLLAVDSQNISIPLLDNANWRLLLKIYRTQGIIPLKDLSEEIVVRRGEINQSTFKDYITTEPSNNSVMIKGVQIGQYRFNKQLSQGEIEYFKEADFIADGRTNPLATLRRIATQRITGVDEKLRLVASIINPKAYFADSTNSVHVEAHSRYTLEYILALLNSHLFLWRFKLTSTNNNVGTNEIQSLPFKAVNFSIEEEVKIFREISEVSKKLITLHKSIEDVVVFRGETFRPSNVTHGTIPEAALKSIVDEIRFYEDRVNDLVYQMYALSKDEVKLIEETI